MRWLLLGLALLVLPTVAMGQSDTRKVAVWTLRGDGVSGFGTAHTTGNQGTGAANGISQCHGTVLDILSRMGVPYDVFLTADSLNWGVGDGAESDSAWFRSQGYLGCVVCQPDMAGTDDNQEMIEYFDDGDGNVGVQQGSPYDGNWGIPVVMFAGGFFSNEAGISFDVGISPTFYSPGQGAGWGVLADGDSIEWSSGVNIPDPTKAADVTAIAWGAPASPESSAVYHKAWTYKNSLHIYRLASGGGTTAAMAQPQSIILGLGKLFDEAGYVPARPLNLQMLIDHPFENAQAAHVESLVAQMERGKWELNLGPLTPSVSQTGVWSGRAVFAANKDLFWANPHSHESGIGAYLQNSNYDATAWTDTARIYDTWAFMDETVTDTLGLRLVAGYNKHANLAGRGISDIQAYGLPQMGYFSVRAFFTDSTGAPSLNRMLTHELRSLHSARQLFWSRPRILTDHQSTDGAPIWVIPEVEFGCSQCSTWTDAWTIKAAYNPINTRAGVLNRELSWMSRAAIGGMGYFFHGSNLRGDDELMAVTLSRLAKLQRAAPNMFAVRARAEPLVPRRHNTARPSGGIPRP